MSITSGITSGITAAISGGITSSGLVDPSTLFGSALIQWWDATDDSTVTIDSGAPAVTISQIANKVAGGPAMVTNAKANQPNSITTDLGGRRVVHHDTDQKNMYANITFPTDMTIFTYYQLDAYAAVNNRRHLSCAVGTGNDFGGNDRAIFHMQNATASSMRSFANNAFIGTGYALNTGSYGTSFFAADDTGNTMTIYRNNVQVDTGAWTGTVSSATRFLIGKDTGNAGSTYSLVHRWSELFIINKVATASERAAVQSYFTGKYGV